MIGRYFLDTCIFISRAVGADMDKRCTICDEIFLHRIPKYTSTSVQKEIDDVRTRRLEIHDELEKHLIFENDIVKFFPASQLESDRSYSLRLVTLLAVHVDDANVRAYLRAMGQNFNIRLADSLRRLSCPPLAFRPDRLLIDGLKEKGVHYKDALIIADYFHWGKDGVMSGFVTLDRGAALTRSQEMINAASAQLGSDTRMYNMLHARDAAAFLNSE